MPTRRKAVKRTIAHPGDRTGKTVRKTAKTLAIGPTKTGRAAKSPRRGPAIDQRVQFSGTDELPRRKPMLGGRGSRTMPLT